MSFNRLDKKLFLMGTMSIGASAANRNTPGNDDRPYPLGLKNTILL